MLKKKEKETLSIQTDEDSREEKSRSTPVEDLNKVQLDGPDKVVQIGATLFNDQAEAMMFPIEFMEFFPLKPNDMPDISRDVIFYELKIDPRIRPIAPMREERTLAIRQELGKLVDANFVKEIRF